jgi:hypothetical protein
MFLCLSVSLFLCCRFLYVVDFILTRTQFRDNLDSRGAIPNDSNFLAFEIVTAVPSCGVKKLSLEIRQTF